MTTRLIMAATVLAAAGALASSPMLTPRSALAQTAPAHPEMSNVIPDGGSGGIEGKVQSIDPRTRILEVAPKSGHAVQLYASPHVRIDDIEVGDEVDALF